MVEAAVVVLVYLGFKIYDKLVVNYRLTDLLSSWLTRRLSSKN